jgi:hypothetical protein
MFNKEKLIREIAYNIYLARMKGEIDGNEKTDWEMAVEEYNKIFGEDL